MDLPENQLPADIMARATRRGNEYAWSVDDIPAVIDAVKASNLLNVGGQLQFRIPMGGTCECYWVEVDTSKEVSHDLPWNERVTATAVAANSQFHDLCIRYDFIAEGRAVFGKQLKSFEAKGGDVREALCFVWYVEGKQGNVANKA